MANVTHRLQWLRNEAGVSHLQETDFIGSFEQALAEMDNLSSRPEFLLGMVLRDGQVLATTAPNGAKRINNVVQVDA